jgi:hypothetical protein
VAAPPLVLQLLRDSLAANVVEGADPPALLGHASLSKPHIKTAARPLDNIELFSPTE